MLRATLVGTVFALVFLCPVSWTQTERYLIPDKNSSHIRSFNVSDDSEETPGIRVGLHPYEIAVSPNGRLAFVAHPQSDYVSVLDFTTGSEVTVIRGISARSLAIGPDGRKVVVPFYGSSNVAIVDTATLQFQTINVSATMPCDLAAVVITNNKAYISSTSTTSCSSTYCPVLVIDLNSGPTYNRWTIPSSNTGQGRLHNGLAVTPDGQYVIAAAYNAGPPYGNLVKIDATTDTVVGSPLALNYSPSGLVIGRDPNNPSRFIGYVAQDNGSIAIIDVNAWSVLRYIANGIGFSGNDWYYGLGLSSGGRLYITSSITADNNVDVFDTYNLIYNPSACFSVGPCLLKRYQLDGSPQSVTVAAIETNPPASAPTVISITPDRFTNDTPQTITIGGSNFAGDARVRLGTLEPVSATFASDTQIQALVPQGAAAQAGDVVVTNPNSTADLFDQQVSGKLVSGITIDPSLSYQPANTGYVSSLGEPYLWPLDRGSSKVPTILFPRGFGFSADGIRSPRKPRLWLSLFP